MTWGEIMQALREFQWSLVPYLPSFKKVKGEIAHAPLILLIIWQFSARENLKQK